MKIISSDDELVISECRELIIGIISKYLRYKIPPVGIVGLSKALYAISNYPKKVINGYINITVSVRGEDEMTYYSIYISASEINLSTGGSVYDEGVGSDSFSDLFYSTLVSTPHDMLRELDSWLDTFKSLLNDTDSKFSVEDEADFFDGEEEEEEED